MATLELSSTQDLANYLGLTLDEDAARQAIVDANLVESLTSAREWLTETLWIELQDTDQWPVLPTRLHRAAKMVGARYYRREDSTYGTEAFGLLGEIGGVLLNDPTIVELIGPYMRAKIGSYPKEPATTPATRWTPR